MKILKKLVLIVFVGLVILIPLGITLTIWWRPFIGPRIRPLTDRKFETTAARLERGKYLVTAVNGCLDCHSEHDLWLPEMPMKPGKEGAGAKFLDMPGLGTLYTPNITPDKETGIGNWTDDQIARAVREGIGSEERTLFPIMPYQNYRQMSDEDLASVIVYIRSIPAVRNPVQKSEIAFPVNRLIMGVPQPITEPVRDPDLATPKARGEHLAKLASCSDCHTPQDANGQYMENLRFGGGFIFDNAQGKKIATANITPDPSGIPYYDEATFVKTIRTGQIGARTIDPVMPWTFYRNMTDDDLKAIFAYLKALPPVSHHVDNSVAPTMCPMCGYSHGLGDTNKKK